MSGRSQDLISTPNANNTQIQITPAAPSGLSSRPAGGYPALSAFVSSSPSHTFQIFRRFGTLNARCLLYLQDELCQLEHELEVIDAMPHDCGTRRFEKHPERAAHIHKITEKIAEYS
jgi:hypothetical protein